MAIVYLGNFYGFNLSKTLTWAETFLDMNIANNDFVKFSFFGIGYAEDTITINVGKDVNNSNKSTISFTNSLTYPSAFEFNLQQTLAKLSQASEDYFVLGFRVMFNEDTPTTALNFNPVLPDITETFFKDVIYNVEIKVLKNGFIPHENKTVKVYIDKILKTSSDKLTDFESVYLTFSNATGVPVISDIFVSIDKENDEVKSGLPGPLEIKHYNPTVTTDTEEWKVVNGTAQATPITSVNVLGAVSDADIGKATTAMTLALTDKTGKIGKFKFNNVPAGDYLAYSIDTYVNKPQGQAGDLLSEVYSDGNDTALASKVTTNIVQTPGTFQLVNAITKDTPITDVELKKLTLAIGSKKIVV